MSDGTMKASVDRSAQDEAVIRLVNLHIVDAVRRGATEIHYGLKQMTVDKKPLGADEKKREKAIEERFCISYRIDGELHDMASPPMSVRAGMIQRLKTMAYLTDEPLPEVDFGEAIPERGHFPLFIGRRQVVYFRLEVEKEKIGDEDAILYIEKVDENPVSA
jgi:type IV pilus assembly protein PilB